jgi:hypothetical protein
MKSWEVLKQNKTNKTKQNKTKQNNSSIWNKSHAISYQRRLTSGILNSVPMCGECLSRHLTWRWSFHIGFHSVAGKTTQLGVTSMFSQTSLFREMEKGVRKLSRLVLVSHHLQQLLSPSFQPEVMNFRCRGSSCQLLNSQHLPLLSEF